MCDDFASLDHSGFGFASRQCWSTAACVVRAQIDDQKTQWVLPQCHRKSHWFFDAIEVKGFSVLLFALLVSVKVSNLIKPIVYCQKCVHVLICQKMCVSSPMKYVPNDYYLVVVTNIFRRKH